MGATGKDPSILRPEPEPRSQGGGTAPGGRGVKAAVLRSRAVCASRPRGRAEGAPRGGPEL